MFSLYRHVAFAAVAALCAAGALADAPSTQEVKVAVRDLNGGRGSRYAMALLQKAGERLGWRIVQVDERELGDYVWKKSDEVDVVASALYTPEMASEYSFVKQALGSVKISLYAKPETKASLDDTPPHLWQNLRLAYARGMFDTIGEFQNWCDRKAVASIVDVCYPTLEDAEKAVLNGECSMLLVPAAESVEGLEEVAMLRRLPCFAAVSRRRPELHAALSAEFERLLVEDMDAVDDIRKRVLGVDRTAKRVVVGRYLENGYSNLLPDGTFAGANEEVVERIARLNGWTVDWVTCEKTKAIEYLSQGKIDLLSGVAMDDKLSDKLHFPHVPCGMCRSFLYARPDSKFNPQRYEEWNGMDIATGPDEREIAALRGYLDSRGVKYTLTKYPSGAAAELAFYQGRHPVLHAVGTHLLDGEKQLAAFSLVPSYVCCPKDRQDLVSALEATLVRIANETPGFLEGTWNRHFETEELRDTAITPEEHMWIRSCILAGDVVRVDISPIIPPLKDWDSTTAQPRGFISAFFDEITRRSGLHFMFLPPESEYVARRRLLEGKSDILVSFGSDLVETDSADVVGSIMLDMLLVCRRGGHTEWMMDPASGKVAVPEWNSLALRSMRDEMQGSYVFSCPDDISCFRAVRDGEADCAYATVFTALVCMRELGLLRELETRRVTRGPRAMALTVFASPTCAPELRSSLRKTLASFDSAQIEAFISRTLYESTTRPIVSFPGAITISIALAVLAAVFWGVRHTRIVLRQQQEIESRDRTIAERDAAVKATLESIKAPLDAIEARAEYLRSPSAVRDQMLQWTEELIKNVETIAKGLNDFKAKRNAAEGVSAASVVKAEVKEAKEAQEKDNVGETDKA